MASRRAATIEKIFSESPDTKSDLELPEISVCLVTHNSRNWIKGWFKALSQCGYPHDKLSLSIVDNASTDDTLEEIERCLGEFDYFKVLQLRKSEDNIGYGRGQNLAISSARSEIILVINPDAYLMPGSLRKAVEFSLSDEKDICAWEFSQLPYEHPKYYDPVTLETSWNSHACVLFKRSAFIQVGGYDKSLFMYGEDVDLSYKLRLAGFRLRYLPKSKVLHDTLSGHGKRPEQSMRIIAANLGLRRRYGKLSDRLAGYVMVLRAKCSRREEVRATYNQAWKTYKRYVLEFRPINRGKIFFPFNGFGFDRRRPSMQFNIPTNKDDNPKISVVTRVHKKTHLLGEALVSVKNQTYSNIEHIIVFDKCNPYFVSSQKFVGADYETRSQAANAGAAIATGQYLLFLDYDDVLFSDHLEGLHYALWSSQSAVCAYAFSWEAMTDKRCRGGDKNLIIQNGMELTYSRGELRKRNCFAIQSLLIKKSVFEKVGGFDAKLDTLEDWDLWARLSNEGAFTPYPKVSSIFYTPARLSTRFKRLLDLID